LVDLFPGPLFLGSLSHSTSLFRGAISSMLVQELAAEHLLVFSNVDTLFP
jgi:hypothetical protein